MTDAEHDDIVAALNVLLEAERAGVRVARATRQAATEPALADFMLGIEKDEAHWCGMLSGRIAALGGTPSEVCGDFYEKAMAIPAVENRLRFLNRGQAWVVRKLEALLGQIPAGDLHDALREMTDSHTVNIAATDAFVAGMP